MNPKKMMTDSAYFIKADKAAQLERDGKYLQAANYWALAAHAAVKRINEQWASARAQFCTTYGARHQHRIPT